MSETLKELRALPLDELVQRHDRAAEHTVVGVSFYLEEIARRDAERRLAAMERLTARIYWLTALVAAATVVNVVATVWMVLRQ